MSQALYRKWRPQTWDSVIGQQHVVQTLRNALVAERTAHAYLFAGPRGTGKTTTARLLAKAVNCLDEDVALRPCGKCAYCQAVNQGRFLDLIEIDAASNTSVEDVRDLRDKINFSPNQGRYKVYIIDEVHMLSSAAFNALLKTLEEPPAHAIFVLATTEVHKIPATVLSRCQRHEFRRIPVTDIVACLKEIAKSEKIKVKDDALTLIARQSTGAMRDAISLLDQLASTDKPITLELVQDVLGTAASSAVLELVEALIERKANAGLDRIQAALDAGSDPRQFARQVVDYLRDLLLIRMGGASQVEATAEMRSQMARHAQSFTASELLRIIRAFNSAAVETRGSWQPSLPLEMAFIEALEAPETGSVSAPQGSPPGSAQTPVPAIAKKSTPNRPAEAGPQRAAGPAATPAPADASTPPAAEQAESSNADQQASQNLATVWPQVINLVRQASPNTYGLMNSSKSRYMRGETVLLGFASEVLKNKMEKPENLDVAQRALVQVFQRPLEVKCYVDTARRSAVPTGVEDDGMVGTALRDLGGELVDMN
jgi:DNA polymerase-3 subunit gamma/tau